VFTFISSSDFAFSSAGPDPSEVLIAGQIALLHETTSLRQLNFMLSLLLH